MGRLCLTKVALARARAATAPVRSEPFSAAQSNLFSSAFSLFKSFDRNANEKEHVIETVTYSTREQTGNWPPVIEKQHGDYQSDKNLQKYIFSQIYRGGRGISEQVLSCSA